MKNKKITAYIFLIIIVFDIILLTLGFMINKMFLYALVFIISSEAAEYIAHHDIKTKRQCTNYTSGIITEIKLVHVARRLGYAPMIKFHVDNIEYNVLYNVAQNKNYYKIGDEFWLMYNPNNPTQITQDDNAINFSFILLKIITIACGIVSIILIINALI